MFKLINNLLINNKIKQKPKTKTKPNLKLNKKVAAAKVGRRDKRKELKQAVFLPGVLRPRRPVGGQMKW